MRKAKKFGSLTFDDLGASSDDDFDTDDSNEVFDSHAGRIERRRKHELMKRRQIEDRLEAGRIRKSLEDWNDWESDWPEQ